MILGRAEPCGEGLLQERAAETQALRVDAVADALRHVPLDGEAGLGKLLAGDDTWRRPE